MFAKSLLMILNHRGVSQKELAQQTGIAASDISRFLTGEREPKYSHVQSFSEALQVNPSSFFPGYEHFMMRDRCTDCVAFRHENNMYNFNSTVIQFHYEHKHLNTLILNAYFHRDYTEHTFFKLISEMNNKVASIVKVIQGKITVNFREPDEQGNMIKEMTENKLHYFTGAEKSVDITCGTVLQIHVSGQGYNLVKEMIIERSWHHNAPSEKLKHPVRPEALRLIRAGGY